MKQFKIVLPKSQAELFATYAFTNKVRVVLSWMESGDFFDLSGGDKIICICICDEAQLETFKTSDFFKFVKAA